MILFPLVVVAAMAVLACILTVVITHRTGRPITFRDAMNYSGMILFAMLATLLGAMILYFAIFDPVS